MTSTLLHVFFHGLIAFVPNRPADGMMSAYALRVAHHATIASFKMNGESGCNFQFFGTTFCAKVAIAGAPWCICNINDKADVRFSPAPRRVLGVQLPSKPLAARPIHKESASDISWLVNMSNVNGGNGHAKSLEEVTNEVRADLSFTWQRAQTCHIDQVRGDDCGPGDCDDFRIYPNRFVSSLSSPSGHVQALAEGVTFEVPFDNNNVSLIIKERGGIGEITVSLCSAGACPDLIFDNDIYEAGHIDPDPAQDMGSHFLEFYKIAVDETKRRFPIRLREGSGFLSIKSMQLTTCPKDPLLLLSDLLRATVVDESSVATEEGTRVAQLLQILKGIGLYGFQTRVICPMAVFEN
jgi:hypothetical protein